MSTKFYGLTGGIGSGKSTVAKMFSALGVPVLDLDKVGHYILDTNKQAQQQLIQAFGHNILSKGEVDRKKLGEIAFQSKASTSTLNAIMHPHIAAYEQTWRNQQQHTPFAIIEASVLIESNGVERMHGLIVILADKDIRLSRAIKRETHTTEQLEHIMLRQCSDSERKQAANYIIDNHSTLETLAQRVNNLYQQLLIQD